MVGCVGESAASEAVGGKARRREDEEKSRRLGVGKPEGDGEGKEKKKKEENGGTRVECREIFRVQDGPSVSHAGAHGRAAVVWRPNRPAGCLCSCHLLPVAGKWVGGSWRLCLLVLRLRRDAQIYRGATHWSRPALACERTVGTCFASQMARGLRTYQPLTRYLAKPDYYSRGPCTSHHSVSPVIHQSSTMCSITQSTR